MVLEERLRRYSKISQDTFSDVICSALFAQLQELNKPVKNHHLPDVNKQIITGQPLLNINSLVKAEINPRPISDMIIPSHCIGNKIINDQLLQHQKAAVSYVQIVPQSASVSSNLVTGIHSSCEAQKATLAAMHLHNLKLQQQTEHLTQLQANLTQVQLQQQQLQQQPNAQQFFIRKQVLETKSTPLESKGNESVPVIKEVPPQDLVQVPLELQLAPRESGAAVAPMILPPNHISTDILQNQHTNHEPLHQFSKIGGHLHIEPSVASIEFKPQTTPALECKQEPVLQKQNPNIPSPALSTQDQKGSNTATPNIGFCLPTPRVSFPQNINNSFSTTTAICSAPSFNKPDEFGGIPMTGNNSFGGGFSSGSLTNFPNLITPSVASQPHQSVNTGQVNGNSLPSTVANVDKDLLILPLESDPLLSSLQGLGSVVDQFLKAAAHGASSNAILAGHVAGVRHYQSAVIGTAQLVQDQVTQLIATRQQLDNQRLALHQHLQAITTLLTVDNENNHRTSEIKVDESSVGQNSLLTRIADNSSSIIPSGVTVSNGINVSSMNVVPMHMNIDSFIAQTPELTTNVISTDTQQLRSNTIQNNKSIGSVINISNPYLNSQTNSDPIISNNYLHEVQMINQLPTLNTGRGINIKVEPPKAMEIDKPIFSINKIHLQNSSLPGSLGVPINNGIKPGATSTFQSSGNSLHRQILDSTTSVSPLSTNPSWSIATHAQPYLHPGQAITSVGSGFPLTPLKEVPFNSANGVMKVNSQEKGSIVHGTGRAFPLSNPGIPDQSIANGQPITPTTSAVSCIGATSCSGSSPIMQFGVNTSHGNNLMTSRIIGASNSSQSLMMGLNMSCSIPSVNNGLLNKPTENISLPTGNGLSGQFMIGSTVAIHPQAAVSALSLGQPIGTGITTNFPASTSSTSLQNSSSMNLTNVVPPPHLSASTNTQVGSLAIVNNVALSRQSGSINPSNLMTNIPGVASTTSVNSSVVQPSTTLAYPVFQKNNTSSGISAQNVSLTGTTCNQSMKPTNAVVNKPISLTNSPGNNNFSGDNISKIHVTTINLVSPTPPNTVPSPTLNHGNLYKNKPQSAIERGSASPNSNAPQNQTIIASTIINASNHKIDPTPSPNQSSTWSHPNYKPVPVEESDKLFYPQHFAAKDSLTKNEFITTVNNNVAKGNRGVHPAVQQHIAGNLVSHGSRVNHSKHHHSKQHATNTLTSGTLGSKSNVHTKSVLTVQQQHQTSLHGNTGYMSPGPKKPHHPSSNKINGLTTNTSTTAVYKPLHLTPTPQGSSKSASKSSPLSGMQANNPNIGNLPQQSRQHKQRHTHADQAPITISSIPGNQPPNSLSKSSQKSVLQAPNNGNASSSGKAIKPNKTTVFTPYSTNKPTQPKVQPWLPNT